jgi:hypothetical protein
MRIDGSPSNFFDKDRKDLLNNDLATFVAIELAKVAAKDLKGFLVCEGYWDADGFVLKIPLDNIESVPNPYATMPEDEDLDGYEKAEEVMSLLWPWDGEQKCLQPMIFGVSSEVTLECSRPRGCMIAMTKNGRKVNAYHIGPRLWNIMLYFEVGEAEARQIWQDVLAKLEAAKQLYL